MDVPLQKLIFLIDLIYQSTKTATPPLESEEDYFGLQQKKEEKEVKELQDWYLQQTQTYCTCWRQSCHCSKLPWNLQEQLLYYCWLDVEVLAEIVRKFRDSHVILLMKWILNYLVDGKLQTLILLIS